MNMSAQMERPDGISSLKCPLHDAIFYRNRNEDIKTLAVAYDILSVDTTCCIIWPHISKETCLRHVNAPQPLERACELNWSRLGAVTDVVVVASPSHCCWCRNAAAGLPHGK